MRLLGRALLLLVLAVIAWLAVPPLVGWYRTTFTAHDPDAWKLEMVDRATVPVGYLAETARWLTFAIPGDRSQIRIISTGSLSDFAAAKAAKASDRLKRWNYALEFDVQDKAGKTILRRIHHHRTDIAEYRDESGRIFTPSFFIDSDLTPGTGVIVNLNLAGLPQASRIRIRSVSLDAGLADVLVRVYVPERQSERRLQFLWQRLNDTQRSNLAKGSVYPHNMLTEEERINLVRNAWQPIGPEGVRGVDFGIRNLYVLRDTDGESTLQPIMPFGVVSSPDQLAVFAIPEQGGAVRFQAQAIETPAAVSDPSGASHASSLASKDGAGLRATLHGRWYGPGQFAREEFDLSWNPAGQGMERRLKGGLVEIRAPFPVSVRAFMDIAGKNTEITPESAYERMYLADYEHPVGFSVHHDGNRPTPLRLVARYLHAAGTPALPPKLRYEFLDEGGNRIKEGTLALDDRPQGYDQPLGVPPDIRLSTKSEFYFSAPPSARKMRIGTAGEMGTPVLVNLFNRPTGLPRHTRAPEDLYVFGAKGQRIPAWFLLRPDSYETLILGNRSQLVLVQAQPLEDKPELQAGKYAWDDLRPSASAGWLARQVLVPRDPGSPQRETALPTTYTPLVAGNSRTLDFPSYQGVDAFSPTLLWHRAGGGEFFAEVRVDGQVRHNFHGKGHSGATRLPPLAAGRHAVDIRVDAPGQDRAAPKFYINHANIPPDAYVTRIAAQLDRSAEFVEFVFDRTTLAEETLTARFFQPAGWSGRTRVRLHMTGPALPELTPLTGWPFEEREFDVRPDPSFAAPVFDTDGGRCDAGQPFFIVFPEKFPRGRYRLHFSIADGSPGLLSVSRMSTEIVPKRRFLEEPVIVRSAP